jgi:hypothetical protein
MSDPSSGRERSSGRASNQTDTKKNAQREGALASEGVLANLPRTRPQRSSARRDAARRATKAKASSQASTILAAPGKPVRTKAKPAKAVPTKVAATKVAAVKRGQGTAKPRSTAKRLRDPAPRQGFETENDPLSGPVQPPGGVDLLASAAELAGELGKSGLSTGGRLLKDILARLPLN